MLPSSLEPNYCLQLESLITVVQELALARDLETIMRIVNVSARRLTNCDGASFILRDGENCYYADEDAIAPLWKGKRFPLESCICGWTMNNCRPAIIADVYRDERIPYIAYKPTFVKSLLTVPIRQIEPLGAIGIYWAQYHEPNPEEVKILQALADSTVIAMENVQLYLELETRVDERTKELVEINRQLQSEIEQRRQAEEEVRQLSLQDELTQLYNRRGFNVLAQHKLETAKRQGYYCHLLFIDLDGLKQVNDQQGHEWGDKMLQDTAQILQETFRSIDIVARLGGDEFVVVTAPKPSTCKELIARLEEKVIDFNREVCRPYQLSFSVGCVTYAPDCTDSLASLVMQADAAMYKQKKAKKIQNIKPLAS